MSFFNSSTNTLPPPSLEGGEVSATATGTVAFSVGPWTGFNEGDTVQLLGGFGDQVLATTVVTAAKSYFGGASKVETVEIPAPVASLRALGAGSRNVKARWVHKNGAAFGNSVSAESTVQIRGA